MQNNPAPLTVVFSCGEISGEQYGALLTRALLRLIPGASVSGIAGPNMIDAGVKSVAHVRELSLMGFQEVLHRLPTVARIHRKLFDHIRELRPDLVVLIDFPDFNLRLARKIHRWRMRPGGSKPIVVYYIPPKVWVWRKRRLHQLAKYCDLVIPIFPFEARLYNEHCIPCFFGGHPFHDLVFQYDQKDPQNQDRPDVGVFPGSRPQEVQRILPTLLDACAEYGRRAGRMLTVGISSCDAVPRGLYESIVSRFISSPHPVQIEWYHEPYALMRAARVALAKSGTNNLELAFFRRPFAVAYRTSLLTWLVARLFVRVPFISPVNILAGRKIVEELVQSDATSSRLAASLAALLEKDQQPLSEELHSIADSLGTPGVSARVAEHILQYVGTKKGPSAADGP
jgi:lipid-A-disaccharide synthase